MAEVSSTRLYLGNLPRTGSSPDVPFPNPLLPVILADSLPPPLPLPCCTATKADVEAHFATHGTGEITEVKLMNGFGFIEYKDPMDARDVVPGAFAPLPLSLGARPARLRPPPASHPADAALHPPAFRTCLLRRAGPRPAARRGVGGDC